MIAAIPGCVCQCVRAAVVWCWTLHLQLAEGDSGDGLLSPWIMDADIWPRSHLHRWHGGATHRRSELFHVVSRNRTSDSFIWQLCYRRRLLFRSSVRSEHRCHRTEHFFSFKYQTGQVLIFSNGKQKAGGQTEENCRQINRPNQDLFVSGNHLLPNTFLTEESIDQEDGELTDLKVFHYQTVLMRFTVKLCLTTWVKDEPWLFHVKFSNPVKPSNQAKNNTEIN